PGSTQLVELAAVVEAFCLFSREPINIVCDTLYVTGVIKRTEHSFLKEVSNKDLFVLLTTLYNLLLHRSHEYCILHLRSHTTLPGPIVEGNARADALAMTVTIPQKLGQAKLSHDFYHRNAQALAKRFGLTLPQAQDIVNALNACSQYQQTFSLPQILSTNPQGLKPNDIWRTDITNIMSFGIFKSVHVSIDTFSGFIVATAHKGEKSRNATRHWLRAFAAMDIPQQTKTNNRPVCTSRKTQEFFHTWGISHVTGISHSPTGQAIAERAHYTLKNMLQKQKRG
ncbi:PO113 protein, partial [Chloropsis cyanopogon]|nr:PO113 protein [Chloropsis cyanopogon]